MYYSLPDAVLAAQQQAYLQGLHDASLRPRLCRNWDGTPGSCVFGAACRFAHGHTALQARAIYGLELEGASVRALLPETLSEDGVCFELAQHGTEDAWPGLGPGLGRKSVLAVTAAEPAVNVALPAVTPLPPTPEWLLPLPVPLPSVPLETAQAPRKRSKSGGGGGRVLVSLCLACSPVHACPKHNGRAPAEAPAALRHSVWGA